MFICCLLLYTDILEYIVRTFAYLVVSTYIVLEFRI